MVARERKLPQNVAVQLRQPLKADMQRRGKGRMQDDTLSSVQHFLYREARLLDSREFRQWLDLLAEDLDYRMVSRRFRYPASSKAMTTRERERQRPMGERIENELPLMEETKNSLALRVDRLETGMAWAEDPPSTTRRTISNIEVEPGKTDAEVVVFSNYVVYRTRGGPEADLYVGGREDVLRSIDGAWRLARRKVVLDQSSLSAKNISTFF